MSSAAQSSSDRVVTAMRRPPVRQSTLVRASAGHTFGTFVTTIGAWWPVQPFSAGKDRVRDISVEQRQGGRVYEIWDDGTEVDWGTLLTWQPPERFTMTWTGTPATTEVEFTFTVLGPNLTRVTVEHRGWEALTDEQLTADCALPGGYHSGAYSQGWATILARLARTVPQRHQPSRAAKPGATATAVPPPPPCRGRAPATRTDTSPDGGSQ